RARSWRGSTRPRCPGAGAGGRETAARGACGRPGRPGARRRPRTRRWLRQRRRASAFLASGPRMSDDCRVNGTVVTHGDTAASRAGQAGGMRMLVLALVPAGVALAVLAYEVQVDRLVISDARAVVPVAVGLAFLLAGLVAWTRRPANRLGGLMVATGFALLLRQ